MSQPMFTAKQFAAALGMKRQALRWHLRDVVPAGRCIVAGNEADAWTVEQLPLELRQRLSAAALQQRCRAVEDLLASPRRRWLPEIALDNVCDDDIQAATKLRTALLPWLHRQHDKRLTSAEMDAAGVEDYRRTFGNEITARYWRELFTRTIRRDNGFEEWNRLEIYLPENPRPKAAPADLVSQALADDFAELEAFLSMCGNPHDPSEAERNGVWTLALEKFISLVRSGTPEKSAGRRVRQFLFARAKFLAPTRNALRMAFDRKLERWQASKGDTKWLRDGREENGDDFKLPEADRDLLIHRAVFHYRGDIAPAWRDLLRGKKFSPDVCQRYTAVASRKSYVPASIMDSISGEVEILTVMHQGPRAFDSIKGHVNRNYDGLFSLQCMQADDFTFPCYFYVQDTAGKFTLTRGQVLLFIDVRSLYVLGWALIPERNYNSLAIRSLCTHIFCEFGIPDVLYFEKGIWESASLLKGQNDPFTFAEISQGLREFGITFKHAIRPRSKIVERIGGLFQNNMEHLPGYCGRNERIDAPESLRKQIAEVEAGKTHPSKYFFSLDQWNQQLGELVRRYHAEEQEGIILDGKCPEAALAFHADRENPRTPFPAGLRYLLAHDKRRRTVTLDGVTIQIGKTKYNYCGSEIAHLVRREVLVWFDPENPETAVITDLDRNNPVCVPRTPDPSVMECLVDPESGTLAAALSRKDGQASYMKTRFNVVKSKYPLPQRQLLATAQVVELGAEIHAQKTKITETQKRQRRQRGQAQRFMQETGIAIPERSQSTVTADELQDLKKFLEPKDAQ